MPFGPLELIILLVIVLLLFGAKRLPELGRSLGGGMREFKDSVTDKHDKPETPALKEPVDTPAVIPNPPAPEPARAPETPASTADTPPAAQPPRPDGD